jgi:DNA-binding transcriptional ArsR family regulator
MRDVTENELVGTWRGLLRRYHDTWCALDRALREGHQLGASEFEVLDALFVVGRLETDGLVTRAMCANDRRGIYVRLTDEGRETHAKALVTHRSVLAEHLG